MSFEEWTTVHTAQELFEFLNSIPEPIRQVLPVEVTEEVHNGPSRIDVEAYEVRETEGCLERGFRLVKNPYDNEEEG